MCTISWKFDVSGYSIFFNRDEQLTRPIALPPQTYQAEHCDYIAPIDPQGGGSWLTVNTSGLTLALLNFYQGRLPKGKLTSRGRLIVSLAAMLHVEAIIEALNAMELTQYAPFSLLVFSASGLSVDLIRWTGKKMERLEQQSPLISSAFKYGEVAAERMNCYRKFFPTDSIEENNFIEFHRSHQPSASAYSVCMHRDDAQTMSFSQIKVDGDSVEFNYHDGPPCITESTHRVLLPRI